MTNLLALVLVATNTLTYSGPENRKNAPEDAFFVSSWEAGQVLFAVSPDINLRARPKVSSPVVTELPMGTPVKILRPPVARTRAAGRVDHWYPVSAAGKEGFLHGSTLTPFHWHSGNRRATVAWGPNYKILVRLLVDTELNTLPLEPGGQAYVCCGGVLRAKWIGESSAGSPMVEVFSTVEACADEVTQYVDLSGNTPRVVLETSGIHDPPVYASSSVEFTASPRSATVSLLSWNLSEESGAEVCKSEQVTEHRWNGSTYVAGESAVRELTPCPD